MLLLLRDWRITWFDVFNHWLLFRYQFQFDGMKETVLAEVTLLHLRNF